jgi:hypothetical protein
MSLLDDPWVRARVDEALAPYLGRLPESQIEWMRVELAETLASDPAAMEALHRARPRVVDESGEVRRTTGAEDEAPRGGAKAAG